MILYIFLLTVPTLLWAALGFPGLEKRAGAVAQITFLSLLLLAISAYGVIQGVAQAMAP